ncbi:lipopolysaccharide assembly LapA domain-containing protein [Mycolicibacterium sp.]|uniref:lipopolysaccharide assembly LapA domain-containing protein n=1 Tax=Mycolicibacterium sp. TaxID=2320850 RepID=UPI0037CADB3E
MDITAATHDDVNNIAPARTAPEPAGSTVMFTRAAAVWSALVIGLLIFVVLLVFVAQNAALTGFTFLGWHWSLPLGVAMLLAAVCGGLVTVLAGTARMHQLRRAASKNIRAAG